MNEIWGGDVVILGAGAVGALLADHLDGEVSATLVDAQGFGGGQSNHSHGFMHRGHIYVAGGQSMAKDLSRGADWWAAFHESIGRTPLVRGATVGFTDEVFADAAVHTWRSAGLGITPCEAPDGWRSDRVVRSYSSKEDAYDFTHALDTLRGGLSGVPTIRGRLLKLVRKGGAIQAADVQRADGTVQRIRAHFFALAAGSSNAALLRRATSYRGRATSRKSYMAIAAGPTLPPTSVILPGNGHYGLFVVSRPLPDGGNAWLISNFLSLAFGGSPEAGRRLWLRTTLRSLSEVTDALADPTLRWGAYEAPKGELRSDPNALQAHSYEDFGLANLFALAPTKLTLAPLLAEDAAHAIRRRLTGVSSRNELVGAEELGTVPERWLAETLVPLDEFASREGCTDLPVGPRGW